MTTYVGHGATFTVRESTSSGTWSQSVPLPPTGVWDGDLCVLIFTSTGVAGLDGVAPIGVPSGWTIRSDMYDQGNAYAARMFVATHVHRSGDPTSITITFAPGFYLRSTFQSGGASGQICVWRMGAPAEGLAVATDHIGSATVTTLDMPDPGPPDSRTLLLIVGTDARLSTTPTPHTGWTGRVTGTGYGVHDATRGDIDPGVYLSATYVILACVIAIANGGGLFLGRPMGSTGLVVSSH